MLNSQGETVAAKVGLHPIVDACLVGVGEGDLEPGGAEQIIGRIGGEVIERVVLGRGGERKIAVDSDKITDTSKKPFLKGGEPFTRLLHFADLRIGIS